MSLAGWTDLGELIRKEEISLFGEQVNAIKQIVNEHNLGLITHAEMLAGIAATYAAT